MEMTTEDVTEDVEEPVDPTVTDVEREEGWDQDSASASDEAADADGDADETAAEETGDGEEAAPLDELEAEELEMLTDDETSETLVVDEAAEMREIRRAEIAMEGEGASGAADDEFVCTNCFLVKKLSQLADKRRRVCTDCAG